MTIPHFLAQNSQVSFDTAGVSILVWHYPEMPMPPFPHATHDLIVPVISGKGMLRLGFFEIAYPNYGAKGHECASKECNIEDCRV